jgi:peptidoglycan hydrolase-like protein with peptidoglycan-binding domain
MTTQLEAPKNPERRPRVRLVYVVPAIIAVPIVAAAVAATVIASSKATIRIGANSLAVITLPKGGGTISRVDAIGGREQKVIPVRLVGHQVLPVGELPAGERLTVDVTVRRPGWISWLTGKTEQVKVSETTPVVAVRSNFLTRKAGQPLSVNFTGDVASVGYGPLGSKASARQLASSEKTLTLNETGLAGRLTVSFAPRSWEQPTRANITWFPAGARATVIATPSVGTRITPDTKITLTFSKPVTKVLGKGKPQLSPQTSGSWYTVNSHTISFVPRGYGYGLGADVKIALPAGVTVVGAQTKGSSTIAQWSIPDGSTFALQQLLAQLGYLPVKFEPSSGTYHVATTPGAEESAIVDPPKGSFAWAYAHTPAALKQLWSPARYTELTKGAVMAFENDHDLTTDGIAGPNVWKAMINAVVKNQKSSFGYTFVMVSEKLPETVNVWHSGKSVVKGLVNTGIAAAPTATGTYAVYLRYRVTTMSGKNPDGSTYHDPGIPYVSYFNGGDALHGFIRASYGFPQSLGCVEMPFAQAGSVYPYTPIGTIVNLTAA